MRRLYYNLIFIILLFGLFASALLGMVFHWAYYLICPLFLVVIIDFINEFAQSLEGGKND